MKTKKNKIIILAFIVIVVVFIITYYWRSFYCNNDVCITVWNVGSNKSYIIKGMYLGINPPKRDYVKVYTSKHFYVCWNDGDATALNMGSTILERDGFNDFNFYSHADFFKKFRGQVYLDGKKIYDSLHGEKKKKYIIQYIEP